MIQSKTEYVLHKLDLRIQIAGGAESMTRICICSESISCGCYCREWFSHSVSLLKSLSGSCLEFCLITVLKVLVPVDCANA